MLTKFKIYTSLLEHSMKTNSPFTKTARCSKGLMSWLCIDLGYVILNPMRHEAKLQPEERG